MSKSPFENLSPYTFITKYLVRSTKPDALPLICIKSDNPKQGGWSPSALNEQTILPDNANLYICISSCRRLIDPESKSHGRYRASIECASQTHMFMLDDIQGQSDLDKLPLTPTWTIETSPDNYQCLYVLDTPLDDITLASKITKALPQKANSDPSSKNCVRWARLPGGCNNKPEHIDKDGNGFPVRIKESNPEFLYTITQICDAFKIELNNDTPLEKQSAPIIGNPPTGWARYLDALFQIDANCDYDTWFNTMVAMHPWKEQGYIAFDEWSRTSNNPKHIKLTDAELSFKWDSIKYDSSDTKGHTSVIGWAWLQATAINEGWDYDAYSQRLRKKLNKRLIKTSNETEIKELIPEIKDAYLTAADLEQITKRLQAMLQVHNGKKTPLPVVREMIAQPWISSEDELWRFSLTDTGNLERFDYLYHNKLWYLAETKEFIFWDNNKWNYIPEIQEHVLNTIQQIPYLENRALSSDEEKQIMKWRKTCKAGAHVRIVETMVRKHLPMYKNINELNTSPTLIGTPSSILNLQTGIEAKNTPDHLITMHTNVDLAPNAKCPRWDQFIQEIMNYDESLVSFIHRLTGYALFGGNPEQLFIILEGHGANGKTTFVNVLQHILGNYAATAGADTLTRPAFNKSGSAAAPDIVRLYRKRLVICNEWNEGTYINESLIKVLSGGGDQISVRALYANKTIDYIPEFLIMLATNHRPNIAGMDYGLWRRLLIIPFDVNFTDVEHIAKREPHLEQYLKDNEAPGIFNWLVEGYRQWQEQGIGTSIETGIPAKLIDIKQQYQLDMDTVGQFLLEQTQNIFNHDEHDCMTHRVRSVDIYRIYNHWATDNGYKAKGSKAFSQAMIHRGFKSIRIGTVRGFAGVRLLTPSELMADNPKTIEGEQRVVN